MFSDIFSTIDDTLIDEYFQPACDHIRKKFGWTKDTLAAIAYIVSAYCLIPIALASFCGNWIHILIGTSMLLCIPFTFWYAKRLLQQEFNGHQSIEHKDSARMTDTNKRKCALALLIVSLPVLITVLTYPDLWPLALAYLFGSIANIHALYFRACTDPSEQRFSDQEILLATRVFYE